MAIGVDLADRSVTHMKYKRPVPDTDVAETRCSVLKKVGEKGPVMAAQ